MAAKIAATKGRLCAPNRRAVLCGAAAGLAVNIVPGAAFAASEIDDWVMAQMEGARIPGLALGAARDGSVIFAKGYGYADLADRRPVTAQTMFHIASVTKTITASAMMLLVERGMIGLDDKVAPHLDFQIGGSDADTMTFRHLLMHISGISDRLYYEIDFRRRGGDATIGLGDFLKAYLAVGGRHGVRLANPPGSVWDYSNVGYALLGYLAGRVAGTDMRQLTREAFFDKLGLSHVSWTLADTPQALRAIPYEIEDDRVAAVSPVGFPDWPAGMIRAGIADLTRLIAAAANGGASRGVRLLSESSMAAMLKMHTPKGLPEWLSGQGLGWQQSLLNGVPRVNHWGGDPGVFTMAYLAPERRCGIVLLSNLSPTPDARAAMKALATGALERFA